MNWIVFDFRLANKLWIDYITTLIDWIWTTVMGMNGQRWNLPVIGDV